MIEVTDVASTSPTWFPSLSTRISSTVAPSIGSRPVTAAAAGEIKKLRANSMAPGGLSNATVAAGAEAVPEIETSEVLLFSDASLSLDDPPQPASRSEEERALANAMWFIFFTEDS
ncbi:hypothetical protein MARINON1_51435 [Marinobacter salarius]|nr:hypothetical protein MBHK15_130176 [Marinobacter salarius]VXB84748.1 hypothetical protein MARINON1_51435 [Marinobacter salarius]